METAERERPKRRKPSRAAVRARPTGWGWLSGAWKAHYYDDEGTTLCRRYKNVKRVGFIPDEEPEKLQRWKCVKCLHQLRGLRA